MIEHNFLTIALCIDPDNYGESTIVMTARYFDTFRKTSYLRFDLWHEVGHYHLGHYFDTIHNENGSSNDYRMKCFEQGDIMPEEKAADVFGLYYTSKDDAIQALSESIRRRTYTFESPEIQNQAIEEFRRRKRFLRDLDSDEKTREMLCQLCNKDNYLKI